MSRTVEITHNLGPQEEFTTLYLDPKGKPMLTAVDVTFQEMAYNLIANDRVFTRFAWTAGASRVLTTDPDDEERGTFIRHIDKQMSKWSIGYESANVSTH